MSDIFLEALQEAADEMEASNDGGVSENVQDAAAPDGTERGAEAPDTEQGEAPEAESPDEQKPEAEQVKESELFSDQALATKEGVRAAREYLRKQLDTARESKRTHDRAFLKLRNREQKFKHKLEEWKKEDQAFRSHKDQLIANLNVLRTGDAASILGAIQQLTGRDAVSVYEEMSRAMIGKKKPDEAYQQLAQRFERLEQTLAQEREQAARERAQAESNRVIEQEKANLVRHAAASQQHPLLARYTPGNEVEVGNAVADIIIKAYNAGQPMTREDAFDVLEQHLQKLSNTFSGQAPATQQASNPVVGRAQSNGNMPVTAPRSPGQSLTARQVATSGSQRQMSQSEIYAELEDDPAIQRAFGAMLGT